MKALATLRYVAPLVLLLGSSTTSLRADEGEPPTRAARLTYLKGTVTATQPSQTESIPAQVNLPLLSGVLLTTADDGQAEVEFEDGSVVRLTPNSALDLESLIVDADGIATSRLRLEHGLAFVELRATNVYRYYFSAGDDSIQPVENSTVRIDLDAPPPIFSVLSGSIRVDGPEGLRADVRAGENLSPDAIDAGQYHRNQGIVEDTWNQWNADMDREAASQGSSSTDVRGNYAGQQGYGWSDLDTNGTWYDTDSGPVWQPYAADHASFDPYSNGSWVAYSSVGYIWASAYPWGWTPYRCGNWSYFHSFGWGWSPGSSCGTIGWRFQVGGRPVNIASAPQSYRPIRVPTPGHGVQRPILHVGSEHPIFAGPPRHDDHRARQIGGVTVAPLQPHHDVWRNSTAVTALRRDFPVDGRTRQAIMGVENSRAPAVHMWAVQPQSPAAGARPPAPLDPPGRVNQPVYTVQPQPATVNDRRAYRERRDAGASAPAQTYTPGPATTPEQPTYTAPRFIITGPPPHRTSTPPPSVITGSQTHPAYTPPARSTSQAHPVYTPSPSTVGGSQTHPTYTPPPAPSHPTYTPPPAPAAAPRPSAPAPASGGEPRPAMRSGTGR